MTFLPSHSGSMVFREFASAFPYPLEKLSLFTEHLLYGPSSIELGERELIAAYVGTLTGCDYVRQSHRFAAIAHGMSVDIVDAILEQKELEAEDDRLSSILQLVRELTLKPNTCGPELISAMLRACVNEEAVRQVVYLTGYWAMIVRVVDGLGMTGDFAYHRNMGPKLAREGREIHDRLTRHATS